MSSIRFAERVSTIAPSATVAIGQKAAELRAQGVDVISFSLGEPDVETPDFIREAVASALRTTGTSHYTAVRGTPALRAAIAADSAARRGGHVHSPDEIVVSVGAKHSLFNLALALFEPGDEVIIPAPYWVSYPEQVRFVGATPVCTETRIETGYKLTPALLSAALTPATKAIILCSPCNPTGSAYTSDELAALAEVLRPHNCLIITDEIYGDLVYDGFKQRSILEVAPDLRERIIIVDGVSKTYAMTGWRIGWILAPKAVARVCDMIQSQSTTNPTAAAQIAALAALKGPREATEKMRASFATRRNRMVDGLNRIGGLSCRMPEGAFYAFVDVRGLYGKAAGERVLRDDVAIAEWMLLDAQCAVVPGAPFGAPGHVRMSYATSEALIDEGLRRIAAAIAKLR